MRKGHKGDLAAAIGATEKKAEPKAKAAATKKKTTKAKAAEPAEEKVEYESAT